MTDVGTPSRATVTCDEDTEYGFVLADEHAPDAETAARLMVEEARAEWDIEFTEPVYPEDAVKRCYKWLDEESMTQCERDDPDFDSEWWCFTLPEIA